MRLRAEGYVVHMTIAIVAAICIILLILAFLAPRLSHKPQSGVNRVFGAGGRTAGKAPGVRALPAQAVRPLQQGRQQERVGGPQGPRQDADVASGQQL